MLVYLKYFLNNSPFPICIVYIYAIFPNSEGFLPYSQNTALKRKCKVSFVQCFVLEILFEKKKNTVGGTRNDLFGYSKTSNIFRLISKYLLLASQTNMNVICKIFSTVLGDDATEVNGKCRFQNQVIFFEEV